MPDNEEIIRNLTNHYHIKVIKAFGNVDSASKSIEIIAKSLKEIYRYFEPDFFLVIFLYVRILMISLVLMNQEVHIYMIRIFF